jgi:hypothetical protein
MRLIHLSVAAMLFPGWACAQSGANVPVVTAVYFLKDEVHRQWCGYARESQLKAHIEAVRAMNLGKTDYKNDRVVAVRVIEGDETGDWEVQDEYTVDGAGRIRTLKRTVNIVPEDTREEQDFLITNGKVTQRRSTRRELRTGKRTQKRVEWFQAPPVVTRLQNFPFSELIFAKRQAVWSTGQVCVPEGKN